MNEDYKATFFVEALKAYLLHHPSYLAYSIALFYCFFFCYFSLTSLKGQTGHHAELNESYDQMQEKLRMRIALIYICHRLKN